MKSKRMENETKQLTRVIAFVKSLGGLYADIAVDAQEELDKIVTENEKLSENFQKEWDLGDWIDDFQ